jgi:hypothetical protein
MTRHANPNSGLHFSNPCFHFLDGWVFARSRDPAGLLVTENAKVFRPSSTTAEIGENGGADQ